jgi:nucleotide-binding universal stress UspA family protein
MNTILLATDFSAAADNAALYAVRLAQQLGASIHILHVYEMPISMNDVPVMMVSAEELKKNADHGLERVKELIEKNGPALSVATESRLGALAAEIKDCCTELQPLLVVAGKHGASGVERFLFGSSTLSIIRHAGAPVLAVPEAATECRIQQVALAVDDESAHQHVAVLEQLLQRLGASLHLVHVQLHNKEAHTSAPILLHLNPQCHVVQAEDFAKGMEQFLQTHRIDLLAMMPHEHSWMERVFFKTHTAELLEKIRIPILCVPEGKTVSA